MITVVKADYSTALTLLLRYPSPSAPYPPVSFVEDAKYLRENLSTGGGKYIITKYSKRVPEARQPRPSIQKPPTRRALSPSTLPLFQTAQIESIVQDVAKNVLDRSEKWGVNRAVREAVVEGSGVSAQAVARRRGWSGGTGSLPAGCGWRREEEAARAYFGYQLGPEMSVRRRATMPSGGSRMLRRVYSMTPDRQIKTPHLH